LTCGACLKSGGQCYVFVSAEMMHFKFKTTEGSF
jgi:hypothetical protein